MYSQLLVLRPYHSSSCFMVVALCNMCFTVFSNSTAKIDILVTRFYKTIAKLLSDLLYIKLLFCLTQSFPCELQFMQMLNGINRIYSLPTKKIVKACLLSVKTETETERNTTHKY